MISWKSLKKKNMLEMALWEFLAEEIMIASHLSSSSKSEGMPV